MKNIRKLWVDVTSSHEDEDGTSRPNTPIRSVVVPCPFPAKSLSAALCSLSATQSCCMSGRGWQWRVHGLGA